MIPSPAQQRRTRTLQVGFLIVLGVCVAQLTYWLVDEMRYTSAVTAERLERLGGDTAAPPVQEEVARVLDAAARRRNRYLWEGGFFLAVLLAAMAVVYQALHEEADLRRQQEDFLAAMSHELKSPLASLRLSADTLAMRDPPVERRHEIVQRLLGDVDRLQRMISNVLDASRLSAPATRTLRERVSLRQAVSDTLRELEGLADDGKVRMDVEVAPDAMIEADPEGVRTVLRNVLHNALRAAPHHSTIRLRAGRAGREVRLEVRDDGIGFTPFEASRIFEKFYRIEGADRPEGTGLGLYLVRQLITRDGGTVTAESDGPGCGARFMLTWPAAREAAT